MFEIELLCDGWTIYNLTNGKYYVWNHNNPDLGTTAIRAMLEDLNFKVEVEEIV